MSWDKNNYEVIKVCSSTKLPGDEIFENTKHMQQITVV